MSDYRYPASRNFDPTKVEDLGSLPPAALTAESVKPPVGGLAKLKRSAPQETQKKAPAVSSSEVKPSSKRRGRKKGPDLHVTSVRLPESLVQAVLEQRRETGLNKGLVLLRAIESCGDSLAELIQAGRVVPTSKLGFDFQGAVGRSQESEPTKVLNFSLLAANLKVLDELVQSVGARDRSELITAALREYFKQEKDGQ